MSGYGFYRGRAAGGGAGMRASGACAEECLALSSPSAQMQETYIKEIYKTLVTLKGS